MSNNIITGEKIQQLCDIYLGAPSDFIFNPLIGEQTNKHTNIYNIKENFDNPKIVFCYTYRIRELSSIIHLFQNPFVLITHNADEDIINTDYVCHILNHPKLIKWYTQNLCIQHNEKIQMLPIGFANGQWPHGNLSLFEEENIFKNNLAVDNKINHIFFNFSIWTNARKRQPCYDILINRLNWLPNIEPLDNLKRLSTYKFCICPEGNGVDSHRVWEAVYLKVVPIVINSEFTQTLVENNVPLVILNSWNDLDINSLNYDEYKDKFNNEKFKNLIDFEHIKNKILSHIN